MLRASGSVASFVFTVNAPICFIKVLSSCFKWVIMTIFHFKVCLKPLVHTLDSAWARLSHAVRLYSSGAGDMAQ